MKRSVLSSIFFAAILVGCGQMDEFEKNTTIKDYSWKSTDSITGVVKVADLSKKFNVFVVVRHTNAYKYNNIWLQIAASQNGISIVNSRFDIPLATDAEGWFGVGMNDFWEYRHKLNNAPIAFTQVGAVNFSIKHDMRDEPLPNITAIGLRVEPALP